MVFACSSLSDGAAQQGQIKRMNTQAPGRTGCALVIHRNVGVMCATQRLPDMGGQKIGETMIRRSCYDDTEKIRVRRKISKDLSMRVACTLEG